MYSFYKKEMSKHPKLTPEEEAVATPEQLVMHNLHIPMIIASRSCKTHHEWQDRVQEGNVGLIKASKTFDASKGTFSSWAQGWVSNQIREYYVTMAKPIRVPRSSFKAFKDIYRMFNDGVTQEKISETLNIPLDAIQACLSCCQGDPLAEDIEGANNAEDGAEAHLGTKRMDRLLNDTQKLVFNMLAEGFKYQEVADHLGVSKQRVVQINQECFSKLKVAV